MAGETQTALELDRSDVGATLEPLERATMLPPRAFTDPGVFDVFDNEVPQEWRDDLWSCSSHRGPQKRRVQRGIGKHLSPSV